MLTLAQTITKFDHRRVGNGQCVALARWWIDNLTGNPYHGIPNVISAEDFWTVADTRYWEKHSARSDYVPKRNALLVLRGREGSPHGHVCIVRDGSTLHDTYTFDQNWALHLRCARERHARNPIRADRNIGFLVLKK